MLEAPPRNQWLLDAAHDLLPPGAETPEVGGDLPLQDAWRTVARFCTVTQDELADAVATHFHLARADLASAQVRASQLLPEKLARERMVFPVRESERQLVVAVADPTDFELEPLVGFASGRSVVLEIAPPGEIQEALEGRYAPDRAVERLLNRVGDEMARDVHLVQEHEPEAVAAREAESAPVIRLTNVILGDAVRARASDIHLEPSRENGRIRFRVDGVLQPYAQVSMAILNRVVSCIKIMGKMDIADRLRPQDGRARIRVDERAIDLRLSTVPTRESEKAVVRLLDPKNARRLEDLTLTTAELLPLRTLIGHRDGIVLVTGPTGSGKTTLLYAALREMPAEELNITTVEDPIEYELQKITQIQVEPKRDVTFANALRSILRQDPDVIFIGEIRDSETAAIAVQASLTGHLVLASLHTNDAVGAIARLADFGVARGEIASTFRGATAQRLVRRVCPQCSQRISGALTELETRLAHRYGVEPVVRSVGCPKCAQTGFFGRVPLLEILVASPALELGIMDGATASKLQETALASGMRPLREAAAERVRNGETTLEEEIDRELGESDREPERKADAPHVVIAEDDAVARGIAKAILTNQGYRVSEARDGVAAMELIEKAGDVSLLLLDLGMPRMGGQEVLRRLRSNVRTMSLPVVVLTGATAGNTEIEMMEAGADDYVRKPIEPELFIARIKAALRRSGR